VKSIAKRLIKEISVLSTRTSESANTSSGSANASSDSANASLRSTDASSGSANISSGSANASLGSANASSGSANASSTHSKEPLSLPKNIYGKFRRIHGPLTSHDFKSYDILIIIFISNLKNQYYDNESGN